jgi:hypothetical protein
MNRERECPQCGEWMEYLPEEYDMGLEAWPRRKEVLDYCGTDWRARFQRSRSVT